MQARLPSVSILFFSYQTFDIVIGWLNRSLSILLFQTTARLPSATKTRLNTRCCGHEIDFKKPPHVHGKSPGWAINNATYAVNESINHVPNSSPIVIDLGINMITAMENSIKGNTQANITRSEEHTSKLQ